MFFFDAGDIFGVFFVLEYKMFLIYSECILLLGNNKSANKYNRYTMRTKSIKVVVLSYCSPKSGYWIITYNKFNCIKMFEKIFQ